VNDQSVYGYYEVAGRQFYNKFKAFEYAIPNGWCPHWNFFEDKFAQQDWSVEPAESITELYASRARSLREKYDRLILWYSGGSDSHTVAESFVDNKILLNELWHRSSYKNVTRNDQSRCEENQINETAFAALPQIKLLVEKDPRVKFNFFDAMEHAIQFWSTQRLHIDNTNYLNPLAPAKMHSEIFNDHSRQKTAKITALDKPKVFLENNNWYFVFFDIPMHTQLMQNRSHLSDDEQDVCFFWDPDAIDILVKQAHMIKRWFEQHPQYLNLARKNQSQTEKNLYENIIKSIIYPNWDLDTWQVNKTNNLISHPEFYWFYQDTTTSAYQNWYNTANEFSHEVFRLRGIADQSLLSGFRQVGDFWNLPGCYSRPYFLGKCSLTTDRSTVDQ